MGNNNSSSLKFSIFTGTGAFFAAIFFSFFSAVVLPKVHSILLSLTVLLLVVVTGIIFDMIGVATAVAAEHPFHAKATKKIRGAKHAIQLVRNAHKVSVFCNDVIGDICGTVSGALGAAIVFELIAGRSDLNQSLFSVLMTALVAGLTVGGKAAGKHTALKDSEKIIFGVGRALGWVETVSGINLISGKRRKGKGRG